MSRYRRTKAAMAELRAGLFNIVAADHPMTVRQVFYRAVVAGLFEKTEAEYNQTVARLLLEMRRAGELSYSWISDNTRWQRKPRTYTGLAAFIERHQQAYRRDLWSEADVYLEVVTVDHVLPQSTHPELRYACSNASCWSALQGPRLASTPGAYLKD